MDDDQLRRVVEAAVMAPSIHNTQPWRFHLDGDRLNVRLDRERLAPAVDPTTREAHISVGAAVLNAVVALRDMGYATDIALAPDGDDGDVLARITLTEAASPPAENHALARAIPKRHTHRDPFEDRALPPALLDDLRRGVEQQGAWLQSVTRAEDVITTAVLLSRAEEMERADPQYLEELASWQARADASGLTGEALGAQPGGVHAASVPVRDFSQEGQVLAADASGPPRVERPYLVIIGTDSDTVRDWLRGGMATEWLLLRATVAGVAAQPLTQVLDRETTREEFARQLRLAGFPQMLLRLGYGRSVPVTPRRPADDVID